MVESTTKSQAGRPVIRRPAKKAQAGQSDAASGQPAGQPADRPSQAELAGPGKAASPAKPTKKTAALKMRTEPTKPTSPAKPTKKTAKPIKAGDADRKKIGRAKISERAEQVEKPGPKP
jgi:hypothetical protein